MEDQDEQQIRGYLYYILNNESSLTFGLIHDRFSAKEAYGRLFQNRQIQALLQQDGTTTMQPASFQNWRDMRCIKMPIGDNFSEPMVLGGQQYVCHIQCRDWLQISRTTWAVSPGNQQHFRRTVQFMDDNYRTNEFRASGLISSAKVGSCPTYSQLEPGEQIMETGTFGRRHVRLGCAGGMCLVDRPRRLIPSAIQLFQALRVGLLESFVEVSPLGLAVALAAGCSGALTGSAQKHRIKLKRQQFRCQSPSSERWRMLALKMLPSLPSRSRISHRLCSTIQRTLILGGIHSGFWRSAN